MKLIQEKYFEEYIKSLSFDLMQLFNNIPAAHPEISDFNFYVAGSATYSSNIEGNTVTFETFLKHKKFGGIKKTKEIEEIENLEKAYEFAKANHLTLKNFLRTHEMLSKTLLIKSKQGKIREEKVGVFSERGLVYLAIEPELVKAETEKLFSEIEFQQQVEMKIEEQFYFASMIHLVFVKIHPFMDGNGRASRLLEKWFLSSQLGPTAWNIESEKYYFKSRKNYYENVHLGVNYHELNYDICLPFLLMLPESLKQ